MWAQDAANQARVDALIVNEKKRNKQALEEIAFEQVQTQIVAMGSAATMMSSTVDLLSNGVSQIEQQTKDMNTAQKAMFLITQTVAAANAVVQGISIGINLAAAYGLDPFGAAAAGYIAFGTSLGAAQAGAIMGTTIAGAFDKGGTIPAGQNGIVSEYGDELVNGVLVKGPARVTSREDTAKMMGGGTNMSVQVVNNAGGVKHQVQQIDENTVRIIAAEHFNENIDRGVSSVIDKKGSRADKSLRRNYTSSRRY